MSSKFRFSFKIATLVLCFCNILAIIYLLQLYIRPVFSIASSSPFSVEVFVKRSRSSSITTQYTPEQLNRVREFITIWKAAEPVDLIKRVKEIQEESARVYGLKDTTYETMPRAVGVVERLREIHDSKPKSDQEALEEWRRKKLDEARKRSKAIKAMQAEYLT